MFRIGDYVAHYKEGVCEVVNIGKIDMGSSDKEYYTLKPVYDAAGTVYTPVDNKREQIRQLITKEEAENLIKEMSEIDTIGVTNEKQREAMYKNALLHNQCREWVSLIKTSYGRNKERIQAGKKTINIDERYMSSAEKFLYGELAVVMEMPRDKVSWLCERAFGYSDGIGEDRVKNNVANQRNVCNIIFVVNVKALYF